MSNNECIHAQAAQLANSTAAAVQSAAAAVQSAACTT